MRELATTVLGRAGYTVLAATTPSEALRLAAAHPGPIHLLMTDVILPEMNGRKLSEALSERRPEAATLFVSGYTANVIAHHGVLEEGVAFLEKPFNRDALLGGVRAVLKRGASRPAGSRG